MLAWLLVGITLLILEILSASFFIIFFGLGALTLAALLYFFFFPLHYQLLGFAVFAFLYFVIFRKLLKKKKKKTDLQEELIGRIAYVQESIEPYQCGKVLVGDTSWSATASIQIQKGSHVKILAHNNLTLEVTPL